MPSKSQASNATAPANEDLARQIEELRAELSAITELLGSQNARSGDAAAPAGGQAAEQAATLLSACADRISAGAETAVQRQPGMALGIAAGLGCLCGLLLTRR